MYNNTINGLKAFLDASPSGYHATANLEKMLLKEGYEKLSEHDDWTLVPGGKYFMIRGGTTLIAFRIPRGDPKGFLMSACHTDRPTFKIKENCELSGQYTRLSTEKYGGMLIAPWLDRPLSVAGRVLVETEDGVESRLVNLDRDLMLIPNVAIHMNRKANDGYAWNPAVDTFPLLGGKDAKGKFWGLVEQAAGGRVLGHDLYLYIREKAKIWGVDGEYISSSGLDDLECVWGCAQGFLRSTQDRSVPVLCCFDDEEVGSNSPQGAASTLLADTLTRICNALHKNPYRMLAQSFMVSADNAHAIHPNHPELADPANAPVLGGGVVLKFNAAQRYTTDGVSAAVFRKVCSIVGVPVQTYCNRADIPGGSTLGHISLTHVSVPTADVGLPQLAMHSCYETAAVADVIYLTRAMGAYYSCELEVTPDGGCHVR
ncbi:MAG: M18 family aminopeptidase [Oscillospiraceae bacterium]|nr:M18 family aminopeptidase [Oscillospiraceae bacterium]